LLAYAASAPGSCHIKVIARRASGTSVRAPGCWTMPKGSRSLWDKRGKAPFLVDANLLHMSAQGKVLEDPLGRARVIRLQR
jgi:hypothetical protein